MRHLRRRRLCVAYEKFACIWSATPMMVRMRTRVGTPFAWVEIYHKIQHKCAEPGGSALANTHTRLMRVACVMCFFLRTIHTCLGIMKNEYRHQQRHEHDEHETKNKECIATTYSWSRRDHIFFVSRCVLMLAAATSRSDDVPFCL